MNAESLINKMYEAWGNPPPPARRVNALGGKTNLGGEVVPVKKADSMDSNDPREVRRAVAAKLKEAANAVENLWISDYPSSRYDRSGQGGYREASETLIQKLRKIGEQALDLKREADEMEGM